MYKGIYLCAYKDRHEKYKIDYNDILNIPGINLLGNCENYLKNLSKYDYLIATPPCNYWSRANYRRNKSEYAQKTWHLLPSCLETFARTKKPFIIENVCNYKLFKEKKIIEKCNKNGIILYKIGRHYYFTNILINMTFIKQEKDNIQNIQQKNRQGGENVHNVIEYWLEYIHENNLI